MWGDMGRYGEIWGDIAEIWGDVGRCGGDLRLEVAYWEICGDVGERYGEMCWGDMWRYGGEMWGDVAEICALRWRKSSRPCELWGSMPLMAFSTILRPGAGERWREAAARDGESEPPGRTSRGCVAAAPAVGGRGEGARRR